MRRTTYRTAESKNEDDDYAQLHMHSQKTTATEQSNNVCKLKRHPRHSASIAN